jgi:hypothetical protein
MGKVRITMGTHENYLFIGKLSIFLSFVHTNTKSRSCNIVAMYVPTTHRNVNMATLRGCKDQNGFNK